MTPGAVVIQNDADALKDSVPLEASAEANDGPKTPKKMDEITAASVDLENLNIVDELMNVYHGQADKNTVFELLK